MYFTILMSISRFCLKYLHIKTLLVMALMKDHKICKNLIRFRMILIKILIELFKNYHIFVEKMDLLQLDNNSLVMC